MKTKSIKLLAMSDLHITDPDKQLQLRIGASNPEIDLVIIAGDLTDRYYSNVDLYAYKNGDITEKALDKIADQRQLELWKKLVDEILPNHFPNAKIFILPGNHDSNICQSNHSRVRVGLNPKDPSEPAWGIYREFETINGTINIGWHNGITYDALFRGNGKSSKPYKNRLITEKDMAYDLKNLDSERMTTGRKIDIFVSHVPPSGKYSYTNLDNTDIGSVSLRYASDVLFPDCRYFIFGHNHIRPEKTDILDFSSECTPQTYINCSICRDDPKEDKKYHSPVIFDYVQRLSNTKIKSLFNRWKWWKRYVQRINRFWKNRNGLPSTCRPCPYCEKYIPTEFDPEFGCANCIEKNYLNQISELNFMDNKFKLWNDRYEQSQKNQNIPSTHL